MPPNDSAMTRFLFAILQQKCLKDIDWNKVAHDPILAQEITNGHAARMRYSRFRSALLGLEPQRRTRTNANKSKVSKTKKEPKSKKAESAKVEAKVEAMIERGRVDVKPHIAAVKPEPSAAEEKAVKKEPKTSSSPPKVKQEQERRHLPSPPGPAPLSDPTMAGFAYHPAPFNPSSHDPASLNHPSLNHFSLNHPTHNHPSLEPPPLLPSISQADLHTQLHSRLVTPCSDSDVLATPQPFGASPGSEIMHPDPSFDFTAPSLFGHDHASWHQGHTYPPNFGLGLGLEGYATTFCDHQHAHHLNDDLAMSTPLIGMGGDQAMVKPEGWDSQHHYQT